MFLERLQVLVADRSRGASHLVSKMNGRFFLGVEQVAASVEGKSLDLFRRDADLLRRSSMGLGSIFTPIDDRGFQIGKLFETRFEGAFAGDRAVKG